MARLYGRVDEILAYGDFQRRPAAALGGCLERLGVPKGSRVELPAVTPYPKFVGYVEALPDFDLVSRESGIGDYVLGLRAAKDGAELALYRRAAALTDGLMDEIEAAVRSGRVASELDIALFIEREARSRGCEGTGFETIAAGPRGASASTPSPPSAPAPSAPRACPSWTSASSSRATRRTSR